MAHTHEYDCIVCGTHFDSQNELVRHNDKEHKQSASGMERPRNRSSSNDALQRDRDQADLGRS